MRETRWTAQCWGYLWLRQVYAGERNAAKQRHGLGRNAFPNGDVYEGAYQNGARHGTGRYVWRDKHSYTGAFADNERHGLGVCEYPDGSRYDGLFAAGQRHGTGSYRYANGDSFAGSWVQDRKHGQGALLLTQGRTRTQMAASGRGCGRQTGSWEKAQSHTATTRLWGPLWTATTWQCLSSSSFSAPDTLGPSLSLRMWAWPL